MALLRIENVFFLSLLKLGLIGEIGHKMFSAFGFDFLTNFLNNFLQE